MTQESTLYITANELASMLGISIGQAYKIIRKLSELILRDAKLRSTIFDLFAGVHSCWPPRIELATL